MDKNGYPNLIRYFASEMTHLFSFLSHKIQPIPELSWLDPTKGCVPFDLPPIPTEADKSLCPLSGKHPSL